jgi:hypothetical protein
MKPTTTTTNSHYQTPTTTNSKPTTEIMPRSRESKRTEPTKEASRFE